MEQDFEDKLEETMIRITLYLSIYCMLNFFPFLEGLLARWENHESCNDKLARIEYVFPGYQFGCWMGEK